MIEYEKELNPEQYRVVTEEGGPLLVLAGAGSGKTRTFTYRVAHLLENGIGLSRILLTLQICRPVHAELVETLFIATPEKSWAAHFAFHCPPFPESEAMCI